MGIMSLKEAKKRGILPKDAGGKKRSKYRAVPTTVDGIRFASKKEAKRYGELKLMERAGVIIDLELHPKYHLVISGTIVADYVADFLYQRRDGSGSWRAVIEDCKGFKTPVYRLKKKLMKAIYGVDILET